MRVPLPRQMHVLHNRNFRLYWTGQLVSLTGTWMQIVAQSWLVLQLTGSVAALGVVNFAVSVPTLILTLTGGVAADRWDRRRIMIATQVALMFLAFLMAGLIAADVVTFALLLGVGVLSGVATAYDMPAQQALVPGLVTPPEIPQAIAMNQVIFNGSRLLGPAVGGVALAKLNLASVYLFNGFSFLAVIASLAMIRVAPGEARGGAHGSMLHSLREGLGYIRSQPLLRSLMTVSALSVLLVFPSMAVLSPGYVKEVLERGPGTLGLLMASSGAASMLGAFAMLWIPAERRGAVMTAGVVTMGVSLAGLALFPVLPAVVVATGLQSLGFSMFMGLNATTIQQTVPGALRGRVMSVSGLTFSGMMPVGALAMSLAVDRVGFAPMYLLSAAVYVVAACVVLLPSGILTFVPPAAPAGHGPPHGVAPAGRGAAVSAGAPARAGQGEGPVPVDATERTAEPVLHSREAGSGDY